jgi:hypothetical protein
LLFLLADLTTQGGNPSTLLLPKPLKMHAKDVILPQALSKADVESLQPYSAEYHTVTVSLGPPILKSAAAINVSLTTWVTIQPSNDWLAFLVVSPHRGFRVAYYYTNRGPLSCI